MITKISEKYNDVSTAEKLALWRKQSITNSN